MLPSQNDKQRITHCSFYVFFGKTNSFFSEKACSEKKKMQDTFESQRFSLHCVMDCKYSQLTL